MESLCAQRHTQLFVDPIADYFRAKLNENIVKKHRRPPTLRLFYHRKVMASLLPIFTVQKVNFQKVIGFDATLFQLFI